MASVSKCAMVVLGTAAACGMTAPAWGQDTTSADAAGSDIVVTARRVEERLQDVPISITVFNQEQLSNRNVVNALDLVNFTPSLSANSNFGADNTSFAIRGFVQDIGTPPSVGVYFADVVAPRAASVGVLVGDGAGPGNFLDLQNVQVLKGPQGTLFGRNTTGGAILFVPQKPTDRLEGYVEGAIGNYDLRRVQAVVNVPVTDTFRARFAVDRQKRGGYLRNDTGIGPNSLADVDYLAVRASIVAELTPDLENYLITSYLHSDNNNATQRLIGCNPNPDPATNLLGGFACAQIAAAEARGAGFYDVQNIVSDPHSTIDQWQIVNTTTWRASDTLTIKNIFSYAELRNNFRSSYGGTYWPVGGGQAIAFAVVQSQRNYDIASQSTLVEELQLQGGSADGNLTYQAGGYFESSQPLGSSANGSSVLLNCPGGSTADLHCSDPLGIGFSSQFGFAFPITVGSVNSVDARTSFRNVGLYAQTTYGLTDKLKLTGGLRYTWDRQNTNSMLLNYTFPVLPPFTGPATANCTDASAAPSCRIVAEQKSRRPTWLVGLDYKPSDDVLLYAKYTRGYRAGGIFPSSPANYRVFGPEKVDSYEAGLKWSFAGQMRGFFNASAFYNNFSDQQLQVGFSAAPGRSVAPTTGIVNAGKSRIFGAEIEASVSPFTGLKLDGSYTYLNATIRRIDPLVSLDPNFLLSAQIAPGDPLLLTPTHQFSVTGSYTLPLAERVGQITLGATFSYVGKQLSSYDFNDPGLLAIYGSNLAELEARKLLNVNLNWSSVAGMPVDIGLFASNVTKQQYNTYVPSFGSSGFYVATVGMPRMYGLRLKYRFGQ